MQRNRPIGVAAGVLAGGLGLAAVYRLWLARSGAADPHKVGYPPLGVLKPLDEGLWIVDDTMVASGLPLPIRMTVVRLADGGLLLHSPVASTPALIAAVQTLGPVRHLVAPTTAHWTHLAEWQRACPEAVTWGVPGLRDRLQVRLSGLRIDHDLEEHAPAPWQDAIEQGLLRGGGGFCEAYLFHRPSGTLILCDAIQNLEPAKLPPVTRLLARVASGTRATTARHVRTALRLGGPQVKAAARRMVDLQPRRVLFAHGFPFEADAARRLRRAFRWLLGYA
ncbi:DUF4336 domain-containing protein [Novosphingobium soli]|uniref:DUF4336 domain-containing protein n=1 Tax=Novosphingobium soli TaxID=574956 RepID=A0ABV6CZE8_9SPHN